MNINTLYPQLQWHITNPSIQTIRFCSDSKSPHSAEEIVRADDDNLFDLMYRAANLITKINVLKLLRPKANYSEIRETAERDHNLNSSK